MSDKIHIILDSRQADLLVHILQEYRTRLYEHRTDEATGSPSPGVIEQLDFMDALYRRLRSETDRTFYTGVEWECVGMDAGGHLIIQRKLTT